jgi:hypothetical protein
VYGGADNSLPASAAPDKRAAHLIRGRLVSFDGSRWSIGLLGGPKMPASSSALTDASTVATSSGSATRLLLDPLARVAETGVHRRFYAALENRAYFSAASAGTAMCNFSCHSAACPGLPQSW